MLYTVWIGGVEVCDEYFDNIHEARLLARSYVDMGYTDVIIEARKWSEVVEDDIAAIKKNIAAIKRNKQDIG